MSPPANKGQWGQKGQWGPVSYVPVEMHETKPAPSPSEAVIIPMRAKLKVSDPEAFASTRKHPGGVVVSDGPMLMVAPS